MINYCKSETAARGLVDQIRDTGQTAACHPANVADDRQARDLVAATVDQLGGLDVLINNAGTTHFIPFSEFDAATDPVWHDIIGVNLLGPFHMIRAAAGELAQNGGGEIVNVSSVAGIAAIGSSIPYACSKAALNTLTVAIARTLAPTVRVNAVAPGFIAGRWLEQGLGDRYDRIKRRYEENVPLGKVSEPSDIADAIVSLICGSDMITGQVVVCDGGMHLMDPMGFK